MKILRIHVNITFPSENLTNFTYERFYQKSENLPETVWVLIGTMGHDRVSNPNLLRVFQSSNDSVIPFMKFLGVILEKPLWERG